MMAMMPSREFAEWMLLDRMEPIGERRLDFLAGMLAALIANVNRKPEAAPFKPSDFIPDWDGPPRRQRSEQTPEEMHAMFLAFKNAREAKQLEASRAT
jgi:hypothetical protein